MPTNNTNDVVKYGQNTCMGYEGLLANNNFAL